MRRLPANRRADKIPTDVLVALAELKPVGEAATRIAVFFGFTPELEPEPPETRAERTEPLPRAQPSGTVRVRRPIASRLNIQQPADPAPRPSAAPAWLADVKLPTGPVIHAYQLPIAPLFQPNLTRALLIGAAGREWPTGEVDMPALVRMVCRGALPARIPRRLRTGLGHRVSLLIQTGDGMAAFAADVRTLIADVRRFVGRDRLRVAWFSDHPIEGVRRAFGSDFAPFQPSGSGELVLVVADLNLPNSQHDAEDRNVSDWIAFVDAVRRRDGVVTAIAPCSAERIPRELRRRMRVLTWDRSTGVRDLRRDEPRNAAPHRETPRTDAREQEGGVSAIARALAVRASLAARAEPQLMRALRLEIEPALPVDAEADLYWSPLVEIHGSAGIVFDAGVLPGLRENLRASPDLLDASWAVTQRLHKDGPRALLHEEELAYLALRGLDEPKRAARARTILRELVAGVQAAQLGLWGERAVMRLPQELLTDFDEARMLVVGVARSAGDSFVLSRVSGRADLSEFPWLVPRAAELGVFYVGLIEGGIVFGPNPFPQSHEILAPRVGSLNVELLWGDATQSQRRLLRVPRNAETTVEIDAKDVEIRVLGAADYRIAEVRPLKLFLSCVSDEFGAYRESLRRALTRPNVEIKIQEDFKNLGGDTLAMVEDYIERCDAVVHFVGEMAGSIPAATSVDNLLRRRPELAARLAEKDMGREALGHLTYTQWEAWLAVGFNKDGARQNLIIVAPAESAERGPKFAPTEASRASQAEHLSRLKAIDLYPGPPFTSADNLAKQVLASAVLDALIAAEVRRARTLTGHKRGVRSVAVLWGGRRALSGAEDETIRLWDLGTGAELRRFDGHQGIVLSVAVLPKEQRALSGSFDNTMRLWDLANGAELRRFEGHSDFVEAVAALPDGRRALSGSGDCTMRLWDLETGVELRVFAGHTATVCSVALLPDGRRVLSGAHDSTARLWDLESGVEILRFEVHQAGVNAVAALPDGRRALSGSADKTLRLWDLQTGALLRRFEGHTSPVTAVTVLPDGRGALSGSEDGTVRLWEIETGAGLVLLDQGQSGGVGSLGILPDGTMVLAGLSDGSLRLIPVGYGPYHQDLVPELAAAARDRRQHPREGVFISYAHKDNPRWLDRLMVHLTWLRQHNIKIWTDRDIPAGSKWHDTIGAALEQAKVAILMASPQFFASDYITKEELSRMLKAVDSDGLTIFWIPVISIQLFSDPH